MELWLVFCLFLLVVVAAYLLWPKKGSINIKKFPRKYSDVKGTDRDHYDVIVVGAGPSGATLGYYLGKLGRKVLLLEKKTFPRDKYCGDAVCRIAVQILHEMGLYEQLLRENKAYVADSGGLCSPGGLSYVGRTKEILGEIPAAMACKRIHLDEAIARAATRAGAELHENCTVKDATFNKEEGLWKVFLEDSETTYEGRVLVCADGATSKLATQLGLVKQPPQGSCSRAYVEGGTHNFKADGVIFYPTELLPGGTECLSRTPGSQEIAGEAMAFINVA